MCTTFLITAKDGAVVSGRTMEFGLDVESNVMIIPAGTPMTGTPPKGAGISYTTKYGMVGANALDYQVIVDGINEKGLFFSALYFPGYAEYAQVTPDNISQAMAPHELGNWVLGTCATLEEVRDNIKDIVLVNTVVDALGGPPPLHFIVRDPFGKSLVIEPLQGELKVYDNLVGVMTNSPTFDWHLTNLINYRALTAENVGDVVLGGGFKLPCSGKGAVYSVCPATLRRHPGLFAPGRIGSSKVIEFARNGGFGPGFLAILVSRFGRIMPWGDGSSA